VRVRPHLLLAALALALVAVGGPQAHGALPQQSGAVDLVTQANLRLDGAAADDETGYSVAGAGDVNGDGRDDVIVGAGYADNNGRSASGSAYVVFGTASTATVDLASLGSAGFRIDGAAANNLAGWSVAGAGDVNGDGRDDVIVGALFADNNGRGSSGSAYVVFGTASTATVDLAGLGSAGFRIDGAAANDLAGWSVAGAGDMNGDGRDDVIVGAATAGNNGRSASGSAFVVFGTASTATVDLAGLGSAGFRIDGAAASDQAGTSVAGAGDVNGDGRDDVIVGAWAAGNNGRSASGSAYVVFGTASIATVDLAGLGSGGFRIDGAAANDVAGISVAGAGDVNGDGRDDVIVGSWAADNNGRSESGSASVVFGRTSTATVDLAGLGPAGFRIDGAAAGDRAGASVAGAGDVNGDGRDDVIVGSWAADNNGRSGSGSASVVFGRTSTATIDLAGLGSAGFRIDGAAAGDSAGYPVAGAGDVNGDGRDDVIIGAFGAGNNGRSASGSAYITYGFGTPALGYGALSGAVGQPIAPHVPSGVRRTGTPFHSVSPALPAGLVLDPFTGTISGTPSQAIAATSFTVTMTDLAGSVEAAFSASVAAAPVAADPPVSTPSPDVTAPEISLRLPARARPGRSITLLVRCDEACRLVASVVGRSRARASSRDLAAGRWSTLRLRVPGVTGGPVRVRVLATDAAGNRSVLSRKVNVLRR